MTESPQFSLSEAGREQLQALMTLSALGWRYVTRAEVDRQRRHRRTGVLLEDTLRAQLAVLNRIRAGGRTHAFSEGNIETAVERLKDVRFGFDPGAIFAFVRWSSHDYGTALSRIDILCAVHPGERCSTVPHVTPGGEMLLRLSGWPKVEAALLAIDQVEALGLAPEDVCPDHWRHVHNRLTTGLDPRAYTELRHTAWLKRRAVTA